MTIHTDRIATETIEGEEVKFIFETRHYGDGDYPSWTARNSAGARLEYKGSTHEVTDKDRASIARCIKRWKADEAIIPAARAASLDYGRPFVPWGYPSDLVPVPVGAAKVGDIVWVYSYQAWRRGVVEKIGRTNLTVAVVVKNTGTFSRQSVKPGNQSPWGTGDHHDVWWDTLNNR